MIERLRLPRPQIATKLYGAIALILAVVYVLAAAATQFAGRTEEAVRRFQEDGLGVVLLSARPRGRARAAASAGDDGTLPVRLGHEAAGRASIRGPHRANSRADAGAWATARRTSSPSNLPISRSWARWSWHSCATSGCIRRASWRPSTPSPCRISSARSRPSASGDRVRARRCWRTSRPARARSSTWVCAAAAVSGLLIGPIGLLLLRRVLSRLQGDRHGAGPPRPQRHLGRHPRTDASGRGGQARALGGRLQGQVDRAAAEEGRARAAQSAARRGDQQHAPGPQHVRCPGASPGVQQATTPRCTSCRASSTRPGTVHCALWDHREKKGARHYPTDEDVDAGLRACRRP